jgi:F420-non-reducing hydrogenase small subunit
MLWKQKKKPEKSDKEKEKQKDTKQAKEKPMGDKLKIAKYWADCCGGCDVSLLDIDEKILQVAELADIVFWPIAVDGKYKDLEGMKDGSINVGFYNGAIHNSEQEHIARIMRDKCQVLIAYGSCSYMGGIPSLANFHDRESLYEWVYHLAPSNDNPRGIEPQPRTKVAEGVLSLPVLYDRVKRLDEVVDVDYYLPGCPPHYDRVAEVIDVIASGNLPPKGSVVGAKDKALCEECPRERNDKKVKGFVRPQFAHDDGKTCLLEQGIICMGPATRGGCDARCIKANMPCRGCYGPLPEAIDQGASALSAITSIIDSNDPAEIERILAQIHDPAGYFYRFGLPQQRVRT